MCPLNFASNMITRVFYIFTTCSYDFKTFDPQDDKIYVLSALIVCVYEEPVVPEQAATVTEKLGEYLISVGY